MVAANGFVTGIVLYLPIAVGGYVYYVREGYASVTTAIVACLVGASSTLWVGKALHRLRGRRSR